MYSSIQRALAYAVVLVTPQAERPRGLGCLVGNITYTTVDGMLRRVALADGGGPGRGGGTELDHNARREEEAATPALPRPRPRRCCLLPAHRNRRNASDGHRGI
eukprot:1192921-Prorocentrum_minimum.AAC.1